MLFSDTSTQLGMVEQIRSMTRLSADQWPISKIVASCNNYLDFITGYAIGADKRFQWDDTNHSKLPEGITGLLTGQSDYSFLTDQQGNRILTLIGISLYNSSTGKYVPLKETDRNDQNYDPATYGMDTGTPTEYDKIADNIVRLNFKPSGDNPTGLKFYFQRTANYFTADDTTKEAGVPALLHRGFVISASYDAALTLGLANLQPLSLERQVEEAKMVKYFSDRNRDTKARMVPRRESNK